VERPADHHRLRSIAVSIDKTNNNKQQQTTTNNNKQQQIIEKKGRGEGQFPQQRTNE
jgi:hypothetical protein